MSSITAAPGRPGTTLLDAVLPAPGDGADAGRRPARGAAIVLAASLALWASAKLSIPIGPVPISMQTLVVLVLGAALGPRLGALAVLAYLAEGAAGLPVFAGTPEKGIGLAYMVGPTGGYLVGFVVAAFTVGALARRRWDRSFLAATALMLVGHAIVFAFGLLWLGTVIGWDRPVVALGLTPFLIGTLAKSLVGAAVLPGVWRLLERRG